jgi:hypothetical protein
MTPESSGVIDGLNAHIKILPGPFTKEGAGLPPFIKGMEGDF